MIILPHHVLSLTLFGVSSLGGAAPVAPWVGVPPSQLPSLLVFRYWSYFFYFRLLPLCSALGQVHGDLKGANILISQDGYPMLMDFGNASLEDAALRFTQTNTRPSLSPRWTAPEILMGTSSHTTAGDVYSLGMTILEAYTLQIPFLDRPDRSLLMHIVIEKNHPIRPETSIPTNSKDGEKLWNILTRCWSYDPKDRPDAETVWKEMKEITLENLKEIKSKKRESSGEVEMAKEEKEEKEVKEVKAEHDEKEGEGEEKEKERDNGEVDANGDKN